MFSEVDDTVDKRMAQFMTDLAFKSMLSREEFLKLVRDLRPNKDLFKRVVVYYNVWEPQPSNATRLLFMEQVLLPQLECFSVEAA